ncbi:L-lactate dehydrogenase [Companilactobacillus nodensis]|uniref:L-lactate dehydrogenase n=1 Tax=Companilactobacillus nodensis DSM 19682 = JCM 14932 = NBRC 107160 TaxID=1423775 RepID=A0A0R1KK73_9LACO|nr:L-lactate dehydrogenase [Companilactobacillus nodensis]KRK80394.1 L-lactate dehydrogenase [Companilactobacillus nodensis DSM 19682 = JCM 14932 = NBRC 107160]
MVRKNKVLLVGDGAVGSSFAFSLLQNTDFLDELVIVDIKQDKIQGDALDLEDVTSMSSPVDVHAGTYDDASDADIAVITAGIPRKPGESRLDLVAKNEKILKSIVTPIVESGFNGIFVVSSNPVDILTTLTQRLSGFPREKVIGTGTSLDSARLHVVLAKACHVPVNQVNAYVLGEHGDTSFVNFDEALIDGKPLSDCLDLTDDVKADIETQVRKKGGKIIGLKGATFYGVARSLSQICKAILENQDTVMPVSAPINNHYGLSDELYIGTPAIINGSGIAGVIETALSHEEVAKMQHSATKMQEVLDNLAVK